MDGDMKRKFEAQSSGQGLVEYLLILALIGLVTVLALSLMGEGVADVFCRAAAGLGLDEICSQGCQDGFDNLDGWDTAWGAFEAIDGQMCNTNGYSGVINRCSGSLPSDDVSIKLEDVSLQQGNGYGVWFRMTENEAGRVEGYIFQYDPGYGGGAFLFRKWVNGHELSPFAINWASGYDWYGVDHDVEVVAEGNLFKAYVDGELVLQATDDTYDYGQTGLRTWDSTLVCLDNFTVQPTWP